MSQSRDPLYNVSEAHHGHITFQLLKNIHDGMNPINLVHFWFIKRRNCIVLCWQSFEFAQTLLILNDSFPVHARYLNNK